MRVLDLFAGIGGFSLAAHWMGWTTTAFVERDKFCQRVLRKNFGQDIEIHDDITTFSGKPFRGRVDIITGGFPCQPFSAAGKRKGRTDERHLFPEMLRVISEVKPRWVVAENVRGLLSIESGSVFSEVISSLEGEGYEVITFCVPASAVEAPHRRDRLWIVGHSNQYESGAIARDDAEVCGLPKAERQPKHGSSIPRGTSGDAIDTTNHTAFDELLTNTLNSEHRAERRPLREAESVQGIGRAALDAGRVSGTVGDDPNAVIAGLQGYQRRTEAERHTGLPDRARSDQRPGWSEDWIQAATRLCGMDDVVPNRVDRLKCLGNAVVPRLVFEIFKAIEQAG